MRMKSYVLFFLLLWAQWAAAQGAPDGGIDLDRFNKLRGRPQALQGIGRPVPVLPGPATPGPEYAGSNGLGEIYILPQDNMPMLKPRLPQYNTIPIARLEEPSYDADAYGRIPNPLAPPPASLRWQQVQPR